MNSIKRILSILLISAIITCSVSIPLFEEAKAAGFVNDVAITYPKASYNGFVEQPTYQMPEENADGFLKDIAYDLSGRSEDGFILAPEREIPVINDDGFINPLERELPEIKNTGFINEASLPSYKNGGFIGEITDPPSKAKEISSAEELASISSGKYVLTKDIYLDGFNNGEWIPITPTGAVVLDGQGYKIYNLNIPANSNEQYAGLFGYCEYGIKISNLALLKTTDSSITVTPRYKEMVYAGSLVAYGNATLYNCYSEIPVIVSESSSSEYVYAGGLLGYSDAVIDKCGYKGEVTHNSGNYKVYLGGLVGKGMVMLSDCINSGKISGGNAGGLIGCGSGNILSSVNYGEISGLNAGGIISKGMNSLLKIINCINSGDIGDISYGTFTSNAGGICGIADGINLINCVNEGNIDTKGTGSAGGLVGSTTELDISYSVNRGNINLDETADAISGVTSIYGANGQSGGLCASAETASIYDSYNTGKIAGIYAAGILTYGQLSAKYLVNDGQVTGLKMSGGIGARVDIFGENLKNTGEIRGGCYLYEDADYANTDTETKMGGIVASYRWRESGSYLFNCLNEGKIIGNDVSGYLLKQPALGGIGGELLDFTISDCVNKGDIEITNVRRFPEAEAGGIVGAADSVENCLNYGNLSGAPLSAGIVPMANASSKEDAEKIINCHNFGSVSGEYVSGIGSATEKISDSRNFGKLSGSVYIEGIGSADEIYNCLNAGNLESLDYAASIYGISMKNKNISFARNTGKINPEAEYYHGVTVTCSVSGISGETGGTVKYCINQGDIKGFGAEDISGIALNASRIENSINIGDIISFNDAVISGVGNAPEIYNCANNGDITADHDYAGILAIGKGNNISYCINKGKISSSEYNFVDAMGIGHAETKISFCINEGEMTGLSRGHGIGSAPLIEYCANELSISGAEVYGVGISEHVLSSYNKGKLTASEIAVGVSGGGLAENCFNTGALSGALVSGVIETSGEIINCYNSGNIISTGKAAGLCLDDATITNSFNRGNISAVGEAYGLSFTASEIINSYNSGSMNVNGYKAAGLVNTAGNILNCYNSGSVSGCETVSGIAYTATNIINTYNSGYIGGTKYAAGIVIKDFYQITNCYNSGAVSSKSETSASAGGLAINNKAYSKIPDCVNKGAYVTASAGGDFNAYTGGIIAQTGYITGRTPLYISNTTNTAALNCYTKETAYVGGITAVANYDYDNNNEVVTYYPDLNIDRISLSTGRISYTCKTEYKSNGEIKEYVFKGNIFGDGMLLYTSKNYPTGISLSGAKILMSGNKTILTAILTPDEEDLEDDIIWASDNPSVATVSADGTVTGISEGEAVISATTENGLTAYHNIKVLENAVEVIVYGFRKGEEYKSYPLENAQVVIGGVTGYTNENGSVIFSRKDLLEGASAKINVSCGDEYMEVEDSVLLLPTSLPKQTLRYYLEYKTEPIYIKKASIIVGGTANDLLNDPGIIAVPLLDEKGEQDQTAYPFDIEIDWHKCTENVSERTVYIEGTESGNRVYLSEGISHSVIADKFDVDEPLILVAKTLDNEGNPVSVSKKIPLTVKILYLSINVGSTPVESLSNIYFMKDMGVGLGMGDLSEGASEKAYKSGVLTIEFEVGDEDSTPVPMKVFQGKSSVKVGLSGELKIPLKDIYEAEWSGTVTASLSKGVEGTTPDKKKKEDKNNNRAKLFEHEHNMLISGIPCFFRFGLSVGAKASITFAGPYDKVQAASGSIAVTGGAEIKGGIGGKVSDNIQAEFGPKGSLEVEFPVILTLENGETAMEFDPSITGSISAELIVKAGIVDMKGEIDLGSFRWSKAGMEWDHILKPDTVRFENMPSLSNRITPVGRGYKANGGGFSGNSLRLSALSDNNAIRTPQTLYSNIIKCADAKITLLNGNPVILYTEDNLLRDETNGLTAAYSVYENGMWSEPSFISDDGTMDTDISADGKFAVFENSKEIFSEDYTLDELLMNNEITAAVKTIDGYEVNTLTNNNIYDFGAKVKSLNDKGVVAWLSNTASDITCERGVTSLNYSVYENGWQEVKTVENIGKVTNLNLVYDNDTPVIVYKDSDNILYTLYVGEDSPTVYAEGVGRYDFDISDNGVILSYFDEEGILHIMNNGVLEKSVQTEFTGSENPVIASGDNSANIFWLEESGIFYVSNAEGEWSDRLCFVNSEGDASGLSCVFKQDGSYILTYFDEYEDICNLKYIEAFPGADIMLSDAEADYNADSQLEITAELFNNGDKTIYGGNLFVYDEDVIIGSVRFNDEIKPGAVKQIKFASDIIETAVRKEYLIKAVCEEDCLTDNNEETIIAGNKDIKLSACGFKTDPLGGEQLYADIENAGSVIIESSKIKVYENSVENEPLAEVELGELMPGEIAPLKLDIIQNPSVTYIVIVETENDDNEANNDKLICYDRLISDDSYNPLSYNKDTGVLSATIKKENLLLTSGKLITAVYSGGNMKYMLNEPFVITEDEIIKEIPLTDIQTGDTIRVMIWNDFSNMMPLCEIMAVNVK